VLFEPWEELQYYLFELPEPQFEELEDFFLEEDAAAESKTAFDSKKN